MQPETPLAATGCAFCPEPIHAGQNHTTDPYAHIHCAYERGLLAAGRPQPANDAQLRAWLVALAGGNAFTGEWYEAAAVTAEQPDRMVWDNPATSRLPWVEVSLVPCPGPPYLDAIDRWNGSYQCGRKHWHRRARRYDTNAMTRPYDSMVSSRPHPTRHT